MKTLTTIAAGSMLFIGAIMMLHACTPHRAVHRSAGHLPPGQVKKINGSKSAKPYAPGRQGKH
jgi:hypothetical protein